MTVSAFQTWQSVQNEVLRRIHAREWKPGDLIPNEIDLAQEFGCSRTTVNRALRSLAESGLLDRRRKAGTRIAAQPVAKATLDIAVIRHEIEEQGKRYCYQLIDRSLRVPPAAVSGAMNTRAEDPLLHIRALHLADNAPYALEDRWINTGVVPEALQEDFLKISANEWLLEHAPYTRGDIAFLAASASERDARDLGCPVDSAVLAIDRLTWDKDASVTKVSIHFVPGHRLKTNL